MQQSKFGAGYDDRIPVPRKIITGDTGNAGDAANSRFVQVAAISASGFRIGRKLAKLSTLDRTGSPVVNHSIAKEREKHNQRVKAL